MHWLRAALLLPVAVSATLNLKQYKPSLNQPKYSNAKADFQQNVVNKAQGEPKFLTDKTKSALAYVTPDLTWLTI